MAITPPAQAPILGFKHQRGARPSELVAQAVSRAGALFAARTVGHFRAAFAAPNLTQLGTQPAPCRSPDLDPLSCKPHCETLARNSLRRDAFGLLKNSSGRACSMMAPPSMKTTRVET